jgi:hypothetical protein
VRFRAPLFSRRFDGKNCEQVQPVKKRPQSNTALAEKQAGLPDATNENYASQYAGHDPVRIDTQQGSFESIQKQCCGGYY